jgi:ubiquinone/menaquinone biosynthesis C-methylase UbiE
MSYKDKKFKEKITKHFDKQSIEVSKNIGMSDYGSSTMNLYLRSPYEYVEKKYLGNINTKHILDYCCGTGIYSILPALNGAFVEGIDISKKSIDIAKERAKSLQVLNNCSFNQADADHLNFPDNYFDLIVVYGSLSYLDLESSYKELSRVIKSDGELIIIDSLGHNPVFNMNRKRNIRNYAPEETDKLRTIRKKDIVLAKKYFSEIEVKHFNLFSIFGYIIYEKFSIQININILNYLDELFLRLPIIKWLAFKVVFVCKYKV